MVFFSWVCRLSFYAFYLAQAFKILTKMHELHYCSASIEVRSGGTIGAYAITWSRPIAMTNVPFAKKIKRKKKCGPCFSKILDRPLMCKQTHHSSIRPNACIWNAVHILIFFVCLCCSTAEEIRNNKEVTYCSMFCWIPIFWHWFERKIIFLQ